MPLEATYRPEGAQIALWRIAEGAPQLRASLNGDPYLEDLLHHMGHATIQARFLAGRLALKTALENTGERYQGAKRLRHGRPCLVGSAMQCSITHAQSHAAAIVHPSKQVGIDLEQQRPQLIAIADKFLSGEEQAWAGRSLHRLTQLWTAKEAAYKLVSQPEVYLKTHFRLLGTERESLVMGFRKTQEDRFSTRLLVTHIEVGDSLLAYAVGMAEKTDLPHETRNPQAKF